MRFSELKGRPVVTVADARKIGTVDTIFLDTEAQRVLGLGVRSLGLIPHREALLLDDVQAVGRDAITVADSGKLNERERFPQLEGTRDFGDLSGARLLTEQGRVVGTVGDLEIDLDARAITGYVLAVPLLDRLRHQQHIIAASDVTSVGDHIVVVRNQAVPE